MRLVALYLVIATLFVVSFAAEPMTAQPAFGKKKAGSTATDAGTLFDLLVKGKDTLDNATLPPSIRTALEEYAKANKLDATKITRAQFVAFMDAKNGVGAKSKEQFVQPPSPAIKRAGDAKIPKSEKDVVAAEEVLRAAGLYTDGEALMQYFQERTRPTIDLDEMLVQARRLGESDADKRAKAMAKILSCGPWAIPALNHVISGLDDPLAVQRARHCLGWLEGKRSTELPVAAANLLAQRKPEAAAGVLLAFLPLADDQAVVDGVKAALSSIAARPGKIDAALLAALRDPLPLRRAIAVEVLTGNGKPEVLVEARKLLVDPTSQVRLRTALALTQQLDEPAIEVLIDSLAKLPANERRMAEAALRQLAGEWSPILPEAGDDELSRKIRREVWSAWWRTVDGPALLAAFRHRTLTEKEAVTAQALIAQMGDKSFSRRELASAALIAQGCKVVELLRAAKSSDPEQARRIESCLKEIAQNEARDKLPLSAPCLLAARKPAGAADALLGFLPFNDDRAMTAEIVRSLTSLQRSQAAADVAIIKALSDPHAMRRIAAADALVGAGGASHPAVRKLLTDAGPQVRLQVALVLVHAQDREAVPTLIELVADLPGAQAREADDVLRILAGANAPARPSGDDGVARKNLRAAWQRWWKDHGGAVNLAVFEKAPVVSSGLMVVAELGPNRSKIIGPGKKKAGFGGDDVPGKKPAKKGNPAPFPAKLPMTGSDRLVSFDRNGQVQWQIDNLEHPIDFQMLTNDRVLIAEYDSRRVTERDLKGNILWEVANLPNAPMNVQRLANGNTFIALYGTPAATGGYSFLEVDRKGKTVHTINGLGGVAAPPGPFGKGGKGNPRGGHKMPDGQMVGLTSNGTCFRLDTNGKEIKQFTMPSLVGIVTSVVGNIDVTPKGNIVVVQTNNTVVEYDPDGKTVWTAKVVGNRATRLANGNTLVVSETAGVVELDPAGSTVWHYQPPPGYQAVRAR